MGFNIPTIFKKWSISYLLQLSASLGIPCFSKHRKQDVSTQENQISKVDGFIHGCWENNRHKTVLKQGWKHLKIGLVGSMLFLLIMFLLITFNAVEEK